MSKREHDEQPKGDLPLDSGLDDFASALDWRSFRAGEGRDTSETCPAPERIAALAAGDDVPDREALVDHLLVCSACRFEARAALAGRDYVDEALRGRLASRSEDLATRSEDEEDVAPRAAPPPETRTFAARGGASASRRWLWPAAAVLLVGLSASLFVVERGAPRSADPALRSDRAPTSLEPTDRARLEQFPQRFVWPRQSGAAGYRFRLFSSAAELVWEAPLRRDASLELGAEDLPADLPRDGTWGWEVEVVGPVAERRLGMFWFEVGSDE